MNRAAKWWATMSVAWQTLAVYRLNFLLLVLGPALVFFFIKVSLWTSIYAARPGVALAGFDQDGMIAYQCHVLMVGLLAKGFSGVDLANDIRMGRITAHLLHPFPFLEFHLARWAAFQALQLVVVGVLLTATVAAGFMPMPAPGALVVGLGFTMLVALLWYTWMLAAGIMAFWLEETWVVRVIIEQVAAFCSGSILPLEMYPAWLRELLFFTPFPYMTWVPAKILAGSYPDVLQATAVTVGWILVGAALSLALWRRGLGEYSAAGM